MNHLLAQSEGAGQVFCPFHHTLSFSMSLISSFENKAGFVPPAPPDWVRAAGSLGMNPPTVSPQSARSDQSGKEGCQVQFRERGFLFSLVSSNASIGKTSQCHLPHYCYAVFRVITLTVILTQAGICFVSALVIENYPKPSCFWDWDNVGVRVSQEPHSTWGSYPC